MSGSGQQHMSAAHMTLPLFVLMWTLEDTYITLPYTYKFSMDVIFCGFHGCLSVHESFIFEN